MYINSGFEKDSPKIIELVGPAGSGKTTLLHELQRCNDKIIIGPEIELRKVKQIPIFIRNIPMLIPILLKSSISNRWYTWGEIKYLVYLKGWPRVLRQLKGCNSSVIVLDHGPIFKLTILNEFGPNSFSYKEFNDWRMNIFNQWAEILDMVIWLDAPDEVLKERINTRSQSHIIKGKSEQEVSKFLDRYRISYNKILKKLTAYGKLKIVGFDTSKESAHQIITKLRVLGIS